MTKTIQPGDTVSVHYTGRLENDEIFDSSEGRAPLKFTVGAGQLIQGFDKAVIGMSVGERKTVSIPPAEGYGEWREDCIVSIPRESIPDDIKFSVGTIIKLVDQDENPIPAVVTEISDGFVQMDVNHFLAGKTLLFDIEIIETDLHP